MKADFASWYYKNFCIEKNAIEHTRAKFFIYAIPRPSSLYFHVMPVPVLFDLYNSGKWPEKVVGEQLDNYAVHPPLTLFETTGQNFWQFTRTLTKQAV